MTPRQLKLLRSAVRSLDKLHAQYREACLDEFAKIDQVGKAAKDRVRMARSLAEVQERVDRLLKKIA